MLPLDEGAMARARARVGRDGATPSAHGTLEELTIWLAGVTGADRPVVRAHAVIADSPLPRGDLGAEPALSVAAVAQAVDAGRERARGASSEGASLLTGAASGADTLPALCLAVALTGRNAAALADDPRTRAACEHALAHHPDAVRGPLHALRRLGSFEIALLCGAALGVGEHGLAYLCDDVSSTAAATVAAAIEPGLRPRLVAAPRLREAAREALLDHLGLAPLVDSHGEGALALLRRAAALLER
jgi:nicotinate-nucleotide--dimethylbenzimidazole phosphoribosyltransferase